MGWGDRRTDAGQGESQTLGFLLEGLSKRGGAKHGPRLWKRGMIWLQSGDEVGYLLLILSV